MMRSGGLVLPHRRYSMPETVMRKYRLRQRLDSSESSGGDRRVDRGSQTDSWRSYPSLATPSPRALSSALLSDCQTVSDKTMSTQDSTLSVPSTNSEGVSRQAPTSSDPDMQTFPEREDGKTCLKSKGYRDRIVELAVNIETELPEIKVTETIRQKDESIQVQEDAHRSIACQADDPPGNDATKNSPETMRTKEESSQVRKKDIIQETDPLGFHIRRMRAEIACAGANYDEYPLEKPVVPRYSAVPRTNSMLVNTSSVELYSSDSELSLTDSLEDPADYGPRCWTRHDERPVRGEVTLEQERRRLPKARDAYAYFLSLNGEQDAIRQCPAPEWLRERLRRREEEIRKVYEDKLSRHVCGFVRRRKKTVKRVKQRTPYSSSEKIKKNEIVISDTRPKNDKTVHFVNYGANSINNHNVNPSTSEKCAIRLLNGNNMGLEPKIDNIQRNNSIQNMIHNNSNHNNNGNNGDNSSQLVIQSETASRSQSDSNLLQISEIIKIEMSDKSRTVITKEKQINVPTEGNVKVEGNETVNKEITNCTKIISTNSDNPHVTTEIEDKNTLNSFREVNTSELDKNRNSSSQTCENTEKIKINSTLKTDGPERKSPDGINENNSKHNGACKIVIQQSNKGSQINIDRKIADILINALEENTKAHQACGKDSNEKLTGSCRAETKIESFSKIYMSKETNKLQNEPKIEERKCSVSVQTVEVDSKCAQTNFEEKACITETYLVSIHTQTSDQDDPHEESEYDDNTSDHGNDLEENNCIKENEAVNPYGSQSHTNAKTVDKACNTYVCASVSTQTTESILKSEDILNGLKKTKNTKKKDVQFPPQVIKQIITGTGEYKTVDETSAKSKDRGRSGGKKVKVSKGTNTDEECVAENNKNIINNNIEIMSNRGHPTPFCKNVFPSKGQQKKPQVLELNVPACSCHMCTLQKISPRAETSKTKIPQTNQTKKPAEVPKEEKKTAVKTPGRRPLSTKIQVFEVIPEEKASSTETETNTDGQLLERQLVSRTVQVGSRIASVATNTEDEEQGVGTQTEPSQPRKSNLVIGRFKSEGKESPLLMRQYKGRASLSHLEGQEELLTLSKGWINFYLLKDNLDLSDTNDEPAGSVSRRRRTEEQVEEYTLEIQATPEPRGLRPNLRQSGNGGGGGQLPEIVSSSPSPTGQEERARPVRKRQTRLDLKREAVLTERQQQASRAVEVARSEQSISSITSSTVIMSESPPPQQHKLPERKSSQRRVQRSLHVNNGSSWTVTVAGSSGSGNEPPPDVEMKLTFGKQGKKQEENSLQYQVARSKRQGRMIEEYSHVTRNEKHAVQCVQDLSLQAHHAKSCIERTRGGTAKDNFSYEEDYINRLSSRRSRYSTEDGSELATDLQVTGLAITPEKKPRVPTQSERDILRPQRYKFTR